MRWLLGCVLLIGCSSSADSSDAFGDYAVVKSDGGLSIVVRASPSPPVRGVDAFELTITRDGQPIDGLSVSIEPFMPAHGHGTSVVPTVKAEGSGKYAVENVSLYMAGHWELRTQMGQDHATIAVDVP